jgi:hypothetical protein
VTATAARGRSPDLTVTEVCTAVGYASPGSFSTRFRALTGESPVAYRDRWAARGAPHVPGCFLFVRGVVDLGGTTGPGRAIGEKPGTGRRP